MVELAAFKSIVCERVIFSYKFILNYWCTMLSECELLRGVLRPQP